MRKLLQNITNQTIVIKVGSHVLSADGRFATERFQALAAQICELRGRDNQVLLVASGALLLGRDATGIDRDHYPRQVIQPLAALGQAALIAECDQIFGGLGQQIGQVLVSQDDLHHRTRYLNIKETIQSLFKLDILPILNENDSVTTADQSLGDNDNLASQIAGMLDAQVLIILSTVAGFHDGDPRDPTSPVLSTVEDITPDLWRQTRYKGNRGSRGGMRAKLEAIRQATHCGIPVILANGKEPEVLRRLFAGDELGTLFLPQAERLSMKKRWLAYSTRITGRLVVDDGTYHALIHGSASLLSSGIIAVDQDFLARDVIAVVTQAGHEFARGITNYDHQTVRRIAGRNSDEIKAELGEVNYREVIHRENIVLLPK